MPTIRSYLKLYQSIGMEKLARFRDMDVDNFRVQLLALKHKTYQRKTARDNTPLTDGKMEAASDVHFFVSGDMVHIDESRQEQRFTSKTHVFIPCPQLADVSLAILFGPLELAK